MPLVSDATEFTRATTCGAGEPGSFFGPMCRAETWLHRSKDQAVLAAHVEGRHGGGRPSQRPGHGGKGCSGSKATIPRCPPKHTKSGDDQPPFRSSTLAAKRLCSSFPERWGCLHDPLLQGVDGTAHDLPRCRTPIVRRWIGGPSGSAGRRRRGRGRPPRGASEGPRPRQCLAADLAASAVAGFLVAAPSLSWRLLHLGRPVHFGE